MHVIQEHGKDLRYCHPLKTWLVWNGTCWPVDETAEAVRRAKETIGNLYRWAAARIKALSQTESEEEDEGRKSQLAALKKATQSLAQVGRRAANHGVP